MPGPLAGIKIVEMAGIGAGPHGAMMLSDMGAEVVCVDRVSPSGLGISVDDKFNLVRRGRRSIAVDLKTRSGCETVLRLIDEADALVESFRPGVMERLGLGPDLCLARNPRLVYGRMTGWGQTGPYAQRAGHDINYIGITGALHAIGPRDGGPIPPLNLVGDFGGAAYFAFGVVCALLHARRTGEGQVVDGAMVDAAAALLTMIVGFDRAGLWTEQRGDNLLDGGAPYYRAYETADGKYVTIGPVEAKFYELLLARLGLSGDPDMFPQNDRSKWPVQAEKIAGVIRRHTRQDWCERMGEDDVCFSPVLSMREAMNDPHISARRTYMDIAGVNQPAPAPRFSRTVPADPTVPCKSGQNSRAILADWGFSAEEIDQLIASGVVTQVEDHACGSRER